MIPGVVASSGAGGGDPFFANVSLLAGFDGADGATSYVSEDAGVRTGTFVGFSELDTSIKKFGSAALLVSDGAVLFPDSTAWDFGSGDFTIECQVNASALTTYHGIIGQRGNTTEISWALRFNSGTGMLEFFWSTDGTLGTTVLASWAVSLSTSTWYEICICRDGPDLRAFVAGTEIGTTYNIGSTTIYSGAHTLDVGRSNDTVGALEKWVGSIDEVRITKGVARHVANYSPAVAPFPRS